MKSALEPSLPLVPTDEERLLRETVFAVAARFEFHLATYWFLARVLRIVPVSREMLLNNIAEHTLGLARTF
jgi:hypothetical protein